MQLAEDTLGIDKHWLDEWERGVFLENQKFQIDIYLAKREEFLDNAFDNRLLTAAVHDYAKIRLRRVYHVGVMAGSFSPFHNGHMEIYNQARAMFDKVLVVACRNPDKPERVSDVHDILPYTEIMEYGGQLVDLMHEMNFQQDHKGWAVQPVLVRGIRNDFDRQYEEMYVRTLRDQCRRRHMSEFPVVHFLCSPQYSHVSSTLVRGLLPDDRAMYTPAPYTAPKLEINW
jgi:cytidyltransferase-like protein